MLKIISKLFTTRLLALLVIFFSTALHADLLIQPFTATYQMTSKGLTTTATRTLIKNTDGSWILRNNATYLFFKVDEESIFRLDKNNLKSQQYSFAQGTEKDYQLRFDWIKNYAFSSYKKKNIRYGITPDSIDRLALQLQLQVEMREGRGPDKNGRDYSVADEKDLKTYRITLIGKETITVNNKTISAIHLQQNRPGKDRFNHLWLDPAQDFQMVKFEQWEKGAKTSDMILLDLK